MLRSLGRGGGVGGMLTFIATARRGGSGGGWGGGMLTFIATKNKLKNPVNFSVGSHEKIWCAEHEHGFNNHPLSCKHLENATVKTIKNTANTMKKILLLNGCGWTYMILTYVTLGKLIPSPGKPPRETQHVAMRSRSLQLASAGIKPATGIPGGEDAPMGSHFWCLMLKYPFNIQSNIWVCLKIG